MLLYILDRLGIILEGIKTMGFDDLPGLNSLGFVGLLGIIVDAEARQEFRDLGENAFAGFHKPSPSWN